MTGEQWRPVPGYEGYYEASDLGRVRSVWRTARNGRRWPSTILKPATHPNGHQQVVLSRANSKRTRWVHRLVLTAFVGPAPDSTVACHSDGNPANNRLENLRWDTRSENELDKVRHGTHHEAAKTQCPKGHPYDEGNTYWRPGTIHRKCRECMRTWARRTNERRRAQKTKED